MSHGDRRQQVRALQQGGTVRRSSGRTAETATLPDDARELIVHAERLVYLFPEGFSFERLVAEQTEGDAHPVFDFESLIIPDAWPPDPPAAAAPTSSVTFVGHLEAQPFAIEVRPRSATIIAEHFRVRCELLLVLKEYAERRRREAAA